MRVKREKIQIVFQLGEPIVLTLPFVRKNTKNSNLILLQRLENANGFSTPIFGAADFQDMSPSWGGVSFSIF